MELDALAAIQAQRKIDLERVPGRGLSCVKRPEKSSADVENADVGGESLGIAGVENDDELEEEEAAAFGGPEGLEERMVDLDDSDSEM